MKYPLLCININLFYEVLVAVTYICHIRRAKIFNFLLLFAHESVILSHMPICSITYDLYYCPTYDVISHLCPP